MNFLDAMVNCEKGDSCKFDKLHDFRERGLFVDVTFVVEGEELKAHRIVLSARSEVFETMFTTPMTEASLGVVNITDASKEAFEAFIVYLYSNSASGEVIDEHYSELIYLADKYLVQSLISRCVDRLTCGLERRSVVELLILAESFKLLNFEEKLLSYLFDNGGGFINSKDFEKLVADFRLSEMVVSSIKPTTISESINITSNFWDLEIGEKLIKMRNNGNVITVKVKLKHRRKTLYGYLELMEDDFNWPVEMRFKFAISHTNGAIMHSGQGHVWWEPKHLPWDENERRPRILFEYCHQSEVAIKNLRFVFSITLSQWVSPSKRKISESDCNESKEAKPPKVNKGVKEVSDADQTSLMSAKEEVMGCTDGLDVTTLQILHQYVSSGSLPKECEVNNLLIRGAHKFSLTALVEHCEKTIASKINSESVVELLILARQLYLKKLEYRALEFIDLHNLEVVASTGWPLLKDYPEIVAIVLKKLLAKKPLPSGCLLFSEEPPMPPGISDFESDED